MAETVVSFAIERLSALLVQEAQQLLGVEEQVEWIKMELSLMHAFLKQIDALTTEAAEEVEWAGDMREVAREAEDAIDAFMLKSAQRRRRGVLTGYVLFCGALENRRQLGNKLERIKVKIRDVSQRVKSLVDDRNTGREGGSSSGVQHQEEEEEEGISSANANNAIVHPLLNKINELLQDQDFVDGLGVPQQMEWLRYALMRMDDIILKDAAESIEGEADERQQVWMEEMEKVFIFAENFLLKERRRRPPPNRRRSGIFLNPFFRLNDLKSQRNLTVEIEHVENKIRDVCKSRWAYGMREIELRERPTSSLSFVPFHFTSTLVALLFPAGPPISIMLESAQFKFSLRTLKDEIESMRIESRLMRALLRDVQGKSDHLDERGKAWLEEMKDIAHDAEALDRYINETEQNQSGKFFKGLKHPMVRRRVVMKIKQINRKIHEISEKKRTYEIGDIKGLKGIPSTVQSCQQTSPPSSVEEGNGSSVHLPHKLLGKASEQVEWIRGELKLMNASIKDVEEMEEVDEIMKVWVDEMRSVARDAHDVVDTYSRLRNPFGLSFFIKGVNRDWVPKKIRWIKSKIEHLLESKRTYGIRINKKQEYSNAMFQNLASHADSTRPPRLLVTSDLPLYLMGCLYYFCLFPKDFDVPARRLIVLWVAEGLVHQRAAEEPPENVAEAYLAELIDRNMVQVTKRKLNGKVKTCRLSDPLREICLSKAKEAKFLRSHTSISSDPSPKNLIRHLREFLLSQAKEAKLIRGHTNTSPESSPKNDTIRHLADYLDQNNPSYNHIHQDNKETSLRPYYKGTLSFLSFDTQEGSKPGEDVGNFLNRCISSGCFQLLRVLDLEFVFRPKLPDTLGELILLRYLGLRGTYLEMLPSSLGNLLGLQTLDLKYTCISTLPSSIWKMQQLRHLYLSESCRSRLISRPSGGSLMDLQTLWGAFVDEESPVKDGLDRILNLRKLGLSCRLMSSQPQDARSSQLDAVANWVHKLDKLQSLRLRSDDEQGLPCNLHCESFARHMQLSSMYLLGRLKYPSVVTEFPCNLVELTLSASGLIEDPMQKLAKLPKLRMLRLFYESYLGTNMLCSSRDFPQLQVLKLWKLEKLEEWIVEEGALPALEKLQIRSCISLKMLPDGLRHVKTLNLLELENMPKEFIDRIEKSQGQDWDKIAHMHDVKIGNW